MAINEKLTKRVRELLAGISHVEEKKMFSGIVFMVKDKMCVTVANEHLMCRINPSLYEEALIKTGVSPVLMRGKEYKGFVYVNEEILKTKKELSYWVNLCLDFNKDAKASKKKKK